jgi:glycerol uptake facilitator-like aquaporin
MFDTRKLAAEFIGTFWLVLGGCGAAVLAAGISDVGIGYAGVRSRSVSPCSQAPMRSGISRARISIPR